MENDLISRSALLERLAIRADKNYMDECVELTIREDMHEVEVAPTIEAEPVRHGRWVDNHCTECGEMPMGTEAWERLGIEPPRFERFMDFCPCCGAKMDATDINVGNKGGDEHEPA